MQTSATPFPTNKTSLSSLQQGTDDSDKSNNARRKKTHQDENRERQLTSFMGDMTVYEEVQSKSAQNTSLWHVDYFELKAIKTLQAQEKL